MVEGLVAELGISDERLATIQQVSAEAFMKGMDRAVIFSGSQSFSQGCSPTS